MIKTSLSDEDTKKLQDALTPEQPIPRARKPEQREGRLDGGLPLIRIYRAKPPSGVR
jgi:hypothetical protein